MQEKPQKPYTILVIEDNQDMLELLRRILESEGYRVLLAADGVYGMNLVRENEPDLILLDIIMPGPDGYITLESIRQCSKAPVIMVTAMWGLEAVHKAFELGADDYVKKPFSPIEVLAGVKAKLRRI